LPLAPAQDWVISEFTLTPQEGDEEADIRYTFTEQAELTIGALSMMPQDNFHGMRRDVVDNLKEIGPRLIRWPGGNFAGEYRWKDGLLDVDQRAPLQASMEIETQPHSDGYDYHEINTDDFIALCREVGAEPLITINLAWESPEESAQWVEYCNGGEDTEYGKMRAERGHKEPYNVRFWSLGNEMGYGHMEGPNGPEKYTEFALNHADAMLKVTPDLELFASGPYPNNDWAQKSAAKMADRVKYISLHSYFLPKGGFHYTTPEGIKTTYENIAASAMNAGQYARRMRNCLDETGHKLHISYDEWNQWYSWYRPSCVGEGIFAARMMHFFLNYSNELDMPVVCYFQPVGEGAIIIDRLNSRLTANGQAFSLMKAHQDGKLCKVTDNEDLSTVATIRDGVLTLTLINEKYDEERTFSFPVKATLKDAVVYSSDDVTPYSYFSGSPLQVKCDQENVRTVLPSHSIALIRLNIEN
jgi:alpha-N-arabinofuranosidase